MLVFRININLMKIIKGGLQDEKPEGCILSNVYPLPVFGRRKQGKSRNTGVPSPLDYAF